MIGYSVFKVPGEAKKNLSLYLPLSERFDNPVYSKNFLIFEYPVFPLLYGLPGNAQVLCHFAFRFPVKEQGIDQRPFLFRELQKRGM